MRLRIGLLLTITASLLMAGGVGSVAAAAPPPGYKIVDLGMLGGNGGAEAHAINNRSQVVGVSADVSHAFLWTAERGMQDLGTLPGVCCSEARAINDDGQVVGVSVNDAFLWTAERGMQDLGISGDAFDINDHGQVVGWSEVAGGESHAFLWQADKGMIDLGSLWAAAINNQGQVVGWSPPDASAPTHAVLWRGGQIRDLGTLPGGTSSSAMAINNQGQVVGGSQVAGGQSHAFLWQPDTGMQDLGTPPWPGYSVTAAYGINDRGQVVGSARRPYVASPFTPPWAAGFLWQAGTWTQIVDAKSDARAIDINNSGQVVASYFQDVDEAAGAIVWQQNTEVRTLSILASCWNGYPPGPAHPAAINNRGQVVGWSPAGNAILDEHGYRTGCWYAQHAFVWQQDAGMQDLNDPDWRGSNTASGINDAGQIVGASNGHAVLWQPSAPSPIKTTATLSPAPNAAGWERDNVTVTLTAMVASGGPAARSLSYSASGAQTIASTTVQGSTAQVTISAEGTTTLSYFATDQAGNTDQAKTLTVSIDRTAPTVSFGAPTPMPNANGWNNTDVTIPFTASDALSGVANTTPAASPLMLTGEGAAITATVRATDVAGNAATYTSPAVKSDRTPPVTTAAPNPTPNAAGWNATNVMITLEAADTLSGVDRTEYSLDGAGWTVYTGPVAVTAEGVHALQYRSIDKAGNVETAQQLAVRIDTTPPEAFLQFDPTKQDLLVFGKDAGSGAPTGPMASSSVVPGSWSPGKAGVEGKPDGSDHGVQLRTYTPTDLAGNATMLVIKVQVPGPHGDQLKARLVSIQYGSTPAVTFGSNSEEFHWDLAKDGTLSKLDQQVRIGVGHDQQAVDAHFEARQGQTEILVKNPRPQPVIQKPGLDLLQIVTTKGQVSVAY